jgi:hypothetical protein
MKNTSKKVKFEAAKVASTFVDVTSTTSQTELRFGMFGPIKNWQP